jgi:beta-glucosidase
VLREQWGFDGIIVADYGGVSLLHQHHGFRTMRPNLRRWRLMPGWTLSCRKMTARGHLAEAVERGLISWRKWMRLWRVR